MQSAVELPVAEDAPAPAVARAHLAAYFELTKPGITRLVVLTTAAGFYLGAHARIDFPLFFATLLGTGLVASGTSALNQYIERDIDRLMNRTRGRPLPSGRLTTGAALIFSCALVAIGLAILLVAVNTLTALVVTACLASYLFVYTPLKR